LAEFWRKYWKSLRERDPDPEFLRQAENEFPEGLDRPALQLDRRGFLKAAGAGAALVTIGGCTRAPVEKAIPYLVQPEEVVPGRAYFYSSTCAGCTAGCGLITRNRDGRPVKLEGNPEHPVSRGGLCAVGQASILGLYDSLRYRQPLQAGKASTWQEVDREILARLEIIRRERGAVRFLTGTITSPTLRAGIAGFLKTFSGARHVAYDPLSVSAILDAHQRTHGVRLLPQYRFERAAVIVSFDADFLGTWISPVEYTAGYRAGRALEGHSPCCSYHAQFESRMSLTGGKADQRVVILPSELPPTIAQLAGHLARHAGVALDAVGGESTSVPAAVLEQLAGRLWEARGRTLVLSGSQDVEAQVLVNFINHLLGNYGQTLDLERPSYQRQGNDAELQALLEEVDADKVRALFVLGANPAYDRPAFAEALKKLPLLVSFAERPDETAELAHFLCPDHHSLESWSDSEAVGGIVSLGQPAIRPLAGTRQALETLAAWTGKPKSACDLQREHWKAAIFPRQKRETSFEAFWEKSVERGYAEVEPLPVKSRTFDRAALRPILKVQPADGFSLVLYPTLGMLDGRHAYNAWLQELPDPVTKITWDNYACVSPAAAARLGVAQGDTVRLEAGGHSLVLPVVLQPGQHDSVVAVALGFGSAQSRRFAKVGPQWLQAGPTLGPDGMVGKNVAPLLAFAGGTVRFQRASVKLTRAGEKHPLASTQDHFTLTPPNKLAPGEKRPIVQETTFAAFLQDPSSGKERLHQETEDLWPADHPYTGYRWGMAIDLNACTGCSACVVACQAENNIPVVGRDEVRRRREMHWLRIDRYYADSPLGVDVAYQPMLCQQCENATCETVCPVLATVHSEEGLNQQIYNRCVGTRYCANNCAYKVRRFNWFDYAHSDPLQNLVLNPDVTVRSRGIMEKCTFCVQRIQGAKIAAKQRGEKVKDGEVQTACQQSCPAQAIVFGDLNDPNSRVHQLVRGQHNARAYKVLAELNVRPSVSYLTIVRNRERSEKEQQHG